jgi:drug/metabolite transporter (DMT)-like permease
LPADGPGAAAAAIGGPAISEGRRDEPLKAIALLVAAMAIFSCSDAASKAMTSSMSAIGVAWVRYTVFAIIMAGLMLASGSGISALRSHRPHFQLLRALGVLSSSVVFIIGLHYLPMAEAAAISFISPLIVTALSIPLLGETVGIRRWAAVAVGLIGVVVVIRPGTSAFDPAALFPIISATCWALALIATRQTSGDTALTALSWAAFAGFLILSAMVPFAWSPIGVRELALGLVTGITSTIGQWLIVLAFRKGTASLLAPLVYTQLIWSSGLGYLVFGSVPDLWTFVGAAIIASSGVYTAHRERIRARAPA